MDKYDKANTLVAAATAMIGAEMMKTEAEVATVVRMLRDAGAILDELRPQIEYALSPDYDDTRDL